MSSKLDLPAVRQDEGGGTKVSRRTAITTGLIATGFSLGAIAAGSSRAAPVGAGGTIAKVRAEGRVIVGIGQEAAPFGYRDGGELVGYDVDIARAVVRRLDQYVNGPVDLAFRPVTDETRISWVQSGQVHMSIDHTNITRKRLENIDFTVPYGWDGKGILYRAEKWPADLADFAGKSIGIKRSSSSEGEIKSYFEAQGWKLPELRQFDSHAGGIQALMSDQIDGFTDDNSIIINTAVRAGYRFGPDGALVTTGTIYSPTHFGIGVPHDDSLWRNALNFCLHDLWLTGEFHVIYEKWFGPKSMCPIPLGDHRMEPFVKG